MPKSVSYERDLIINVFFGSTLHPAVATVEATGAHNGVALIIEQQEPQQCEEHDTNSIGQIHLQLMLASIERLQCHPGKYGGHIFWYP